MLKVRRKMSVTFEEKSFCFEEAITYGVSNGKYGGYSIALKLPEDAVEKIQKIASDNGALQKMYGDGSTLYLRCDQLTEKQRSDLLGQGKMVIWIEFLI